MFFVYFQEPSHIERGALPNLIFEDMTVMHDFEIMNLCDHYKASTGLQGIFCFMSHKYN